MTKKEKIQLAVNLAFAPRKEANKLTREFTGYENFQFLCNRFPTLRYDRLRGEKKERMIRLRELYIAATGVIPFK